MSIRFYFVRHGQSEANLKNNYYNDMDAKLTGLGKAQAVKAGDELKKTGVQFKAIFCSPYQRAIETFRIAIMRADLHGAFAKIDERIGERKFDGIVGQEITDEYNRSLYDYNSSQALVHGVETLGALEDRAKWFIGDVIKEYHEGDILLFSHGIFGLAFRAVIEGRPESGNLYDYALLENGEMEVYEIFDTIA